MKSVKKKTKEQKDINVPKEDIKIEKGQPTFLPALKKIINKKNEIKKPLQ